jgi:hypothetical protein
MRPIGQQVGIGGGILWRNGAAECRAPDLNRPQTGQAQRSAVPLNALVDMCVDHVVLPCVCYIKHDRGVERHLQYASQKTRRFKRRYANRGSNSNGSRSFTSLISESWGCRALMSKLYSAGST